MGKAIPTQHPAVVLRSHYRQLRALLAVAMIAVVGLTGAVVIVATNSDEVAGTSSASPHQGRVAQPPSTRYDGGPEEGTRGAVSSGTSSPAPGTRYDGGPEEGTRGAVSSGRPESPPLPQQEHRAAEQAGNHPVGRADHQLPLRRRPRGGHPWHAVQQRSLDHGRGRPLRWWPRGRIARAGPIAVSTERPSVFGDAEFTRDGGATRVVPSPLAECDPTPTMRRATPRFGSTRSR